MIRVGLVGFGMAGRVFHGPLLSSVEGLELAAVMERSTNKAAERYPGITVYRSLEAMLADKSLGLFRCGHTQRNSLRARQTDSERGEECRRRQADDA